MVTEKHRSAFCRLLIYGWIVVLVLAILPWTANPVKPIKDLVSAVAAVLLCLGGVGMLSKAAKKPGKYFSAPLLVLALWFLWSSLAALLSGHRLVAVDELRLYLPLLILAFYASLLFRNNRDRKRLAVVICLAVSASSLYGVFQYLGLDPFPWITRDIEEYRGLPATFGNPNFAGHSLVLVIILAAGLIAARPRSLAWLLLPLPVFHLYQTHMRGAMVALCGAAFLVGLVLFLRRRLSGGAAKKIMVVFLSLLLAGLAGISLMLPLSKKMSGFYFPTGGSLILRYNGYYGATRMLLDNPVLGVGPGNFATENIPYWTFYERRWFADENKRNTRVHCDPLESGVEAGFPGLTLHLFLFALLLTQSLYLAFEGHDRKKRRWGLISAAFFTAFFIDGLFGFNLRVPVSGTLFYLMVGVFSGLWLENEFNTQGRETSENITPPRPSSWRLNKVFYFVDGLAVLLCVGCAVWAWQLFQAEMLWQKGNSALAWVETNTGNRNAPRMLQEGESAAVAGFQKCRWDSRYSNLLGHIALKKGESREAIAAYSHSTRLDPDHPHTSANLARAWLSEAMGALTGSDPDLAAMDKALKEGEKAARHGQRFCPESPYVQDVLWRIVRAQAQLAELKGDNALPLWEETRDLVDSHLHDVPLDVPAARRALLTACQRTEDLEKMEPLLQGLTLDPSSRDEFWEIYLRYAEKTGQEEAYIDALLQALALQRAQTAPDPDWIVSLLRRFVLAWEALYGPVESPVFYVDQALAWFPEMTGLWALALKSVPEEDIQTTLQEKIKALDSKKISEFVSLFAATPESETKLTREAGLLAREAMQRGGAAATEDYAFFARAILHKMMRLPVSAEKQVEIQANLATVFLEGGHWDEAERYFAVAIEGMPAESSSRLKASRARALSQLDRLPEALEVSRDAARSSPEDPLVLLVYGRMLRLSEQWEAAETILKQAAAVAPSDAAFRRQILQELQLAQGSRRREEGE